MTSGTTSSPASGRDRAAPFDLAETDRLLTTTRAVRRRLDLDRPVEREVLLECIRLSQQSPTPSNSQTWRWLIVTDADKRKGLADIYRRVGLGYLQAAAGNITEGDQQTHHVYESALWLADNLEKVPVHVIPCLQGRVSGDFAMTWCSMLGGIFPAVWSFQLALRSRGLGSVLTTLHLGGEKEAAAMLGVPDDVMQVALIPVAYTRGTDFKPAARPPVEDIVHWDTWVGTGS